ncbi:MAG: AMP-binding protein [Acidimicrobiales bacterium]
MAAELARRGIGPGDVVALTLPSTSAWVVAYVAAAKVGATTAGVNPRLTPVEQAAWQERVAPSLVLADADEVAALAIAGAQPGALEPDDERPVAIVFTSGTTGLPKGAWFTDRQLRAVTAYDVGDAVGGEVAIPQYGATQFAHVGFTTKLPWYLRMGTTTHLLARWRAGRRAGPGGPRADRDPGWGRPQVALMLRDPDFDRRDPELRAAARDGRRRLAAGPGARGPPPLRAAYSIRWSSTESGGVGTGTARRPRRGAAQRRPGRPGMGVQVRGEDDLPLPHGEVGVVWLAPTP